MTPFDPLSAPGQNGVDIDTSQIQVVFAGLTSGAPDIKNVPIVMLYDGLSRLVDGTAPPFSIIDDITLQSVKPDKIEFKRGPAYYRVIKKSSNENVLQSKRLNGTWVNV